MKIELLTTEELALEIQGRGLEVQYLSHLAIRLGFSTDDGWTEELMAAIESAPFDLRRAAAEHALRVALERN